MTSRRRLPWTGQHRPLAQSLKRGQALIKFVESLSVMPDDAAAEFSVPAKVLIALLKN